MSATGGHELPSGSRLGPYEIIGPVGAGGMGVVYRARDSRLERDVAIKILPAALTDSGEARERLRREARNVAALQHPNICTIHDVGDTDAGGLFLVIELLAGETVQQRLKRGPLSTEEALDIALALCDALSAAHAAGIIHRDIKPANIFLTSHGPKLLDFGVAKAVGAVASDLSTAPVLTAPGDVPGTMAYMSPEQLRGLEVDARTDVFSLGLVLYEMAAGQRAFGGATSMETAAAILNNSPVAPRAINASVASAIEACILRAIEKPLELRFQSAADFRSALLHARSAGTRPLVASPRRRWIGVAAAAVAIVAALGVWLIRRPAAPPLTERDTIVIGDFRNTTGDAVFDDTLRQGLIVQLQQSPYVTLLPDARIRRTLALMQRSADEPIAGALLDEICVRTGSTAFLEGSIAPLGSRFVVGLKATSCQDDEVIDQAQVEVDRKEDVLRGIEDLAAGFRQRSGESAASRQKYATALPEATTRSLDALKAYSTARRVNYTKGLIVAIPMWIRALELDPQFASAWAMLGLAYNIQGNTTLAVEAATKAHQLRDRTTAHERFLIDGLYQRQVTGNLEKARQVFETWAATYPRDAEAHGLLAGFATQGTGRYEQTIAEAEKSLAIDPDQSFGYASIIGAHIYLNRLDDAERTVQRAIVRKVEISDLPLFQYQLAFLRNNRDDMARHAAAGRVSPATDDRMAHLEALVAARAGRIDEARAGEQRAIALAERDGQRARAAIYYGSTAIFESFAGNEPQARKAAATALEWSDGRDSTYAAAFALARVGDRARAAELAAELQRRFPEDTSVRYNYLPTLRAMDALQARDPKLAITILEEARTYELAVPALAFIDFIGAFYPPFIRGEAYLMLGRKDDAAGEFRRILEHRGLLLADPVGAVAERELAKLKSASAHAGS
jgi:serine/threonine protein kinase/tetratricopeptide (TPR) repeat protein